MAVVTNLAVAAAYGINPTRYLIRGDVPLGGWLMLLTLAIGEILFVAAYRLWNAGLAHYQSTGN